MQLPGSALPRHSSTRSSLKLICKHQSLPPEEHQHHVAFRSPTREASKREASAPAANDRKKAKLKISRVHFYMCNKSNEQRKSMGHLRYVQKRGL